MNIERAFCYLHGQRESESFDFVLELGGGGSELVLR